MVTLKDYFHSIFIFAIDMPSSLQSAEFWTNEPFIFYLILTSFSMKSSASSDWNLNKTLTWNLTQKKFKTIKPTQARIYLESSFNLDFVKFFSHQP